MDHVLKMNSVKKVYKNFTALNGLTMNIPEHSIYGFVGKNGAGKTTLIRTVCGLQNATEGSYELFGVNCNDPRINSMGITIKISVQYCSRTLESVSCAICAFYTKDVDYC